MPQQQIDVNQLNQAKANVTLTQTLLSQAIEKSSSDPTLAQEAIKQVSFGNRTSPIICKSSLQCNANSKNGVN